MTSNYGRDLDLNLLRVFAVVAETGSVTRAADRLYLTQPAISAALRRLHAATGAPLFARQGRGLVLSSRGRRLHAAIRPHLQALVDAALSPADFDPRTSERTFRLGLSDSTESWLLPALLRALEREAPRIGIVSVPVQFRTVADALAAGRVDAAITVADELPAGIQRQTLYEADFVCLFDPAGIRLGRRIDEDTYFSCEHVIVSYNHDLRGIVEDVLGRARRARCSVASFAHVGALVDGSALLATVPAPVAEDIRRTRPHLRTAALPFRLGGAPLELLWPTALDDDPPFQFLRAHLVGIAAASRGRKPTAARRRTPRRS